MAKYPKTIDFECCNPKGFTSDTQEWLKRLKAEVKMTMPADNILQIEYPSDIVEQVRTVNVDDTIFRLDFIAPGDTYHLCRCVFPNVPWNNNRTFMFNCFDKGSRHESKAGSRTILTIKYPTQNKH